MDISRQKIEKFISENRNDILINYNINVNKIPEIEKILEAELPNDYKWFLQKYGFLMGFGIEMLGIGKSEELTIIRDTLRYRKIGLPYNLIVIQNCDEWVNCLNLSYRKNKKSPVFAWDRITKDSKLIADDFLMYLLQILNEGKELWEEDF